MWIEVPPIRVFKARRFYLDSWRWFCRRCGRGVVGVGFPTQPEALQWGLRHCHRGADSLYGVILDP